MRRVNTTLALHKTQNAVFYLPNTAGALPAGRGRATLNADAMNIPYAYAAATLVAVCLLASAPASAQADYAREKRWAEEIIPGIVVGDPVWIGLKSGRKFLAIYAPAPKSVSGVIVVHALGMHPDWGLINALRSRLPEHGYATLSVQMPVLAAEAKGERYPPLFPEAAERLGAAVAWLRGKGMKKVAIVSHSMGARMTHYFLSHAGDARIDAWIAIGITGEIALPEKFRAPVLDLYGEKDYPGVLDGAAARAATIRKIRGSGQVQVAGADHFFSGMESELMRQVRQFLDSRLRP
jgi:predicted alpha/beta-hydrolase family hydrolase